jgi:hypothetical protein
MSLDIKLKSSKKNPRSSSCSDAKKRERSLFLLFLTSPPRLFLFLSSKADRMVNYPTRCICFFVVAIVFFLIPSVGLIYFYNLPLIKTHSQFNESLCTTFPQEFCPGNSEDYLCVSFPLADGFHSSGELLPLRRDRPLKVIQPEFFFGSF